MLEKIILVRARMILLAFEKRQNVQIAEIVRPQPAGASGYHTIISEVSEL